MSSATIATVTRMMESLPEPAQEQVADHLRKYILDLQDEITWDLSFRRTRGRLADADRQAKQEIAAGKAVPMELDQL